MSVIINVKEPLEIGQQTVFESPSPFTSYAVVFEDDGETGYFYALDLAKHSNPIEDAVHIYNVNTVADKEIPSEIKLGWSEDGLKALLMINDYPHAVFDFAARRGYSRNNFPEPAGEWAKHHPDHEWDDSAMIPFQKPQDTA